MFWLHALIMLESETRIHTHSRNHQLNEPPRLQNNREINVSWKKHRLAENRLKAGSYCESSRSLNWFIEMIVRDVATGVCVCMGGGGGG